MIAVGRELAGAQGRLAKHGYGVFNKWVKGRCGFGQRSAYRAIAAFSAFGDCAKLAQTFDASALYLLSSDSCPEEVTEQAKALAEAGEKVTHKVAKADTLAQFARRVRADTETINAIQYGKLLIEAKLGGLLPAGPPGRGKKTPKPLPGFSDRSVTTYRKVSDNAPQIDEYQAKVTEHNAALDEDRRRTLPRLARRHTRSILRTADSGGIETRPSPLKRNRGHVRASDSAIRRRIGSESADSMKKAGPAAGDRLDDRVAWSRQ